jgi:cytochrome c
MGPSFYDINQRYSGTKAQTDSLVKHIREGSSGIWGKEKMPGHTELTDLQAKNIVKWIMKSAADPTVSYYVGTNGYFQLQSTPGAGTYLLTASYTDHGVKGTSVKPIKGQDAVVIRSK